MCATKTRVRKIGAVGPDSRAGAHGHKLAAGEVPNRRQLASARRRKAILDAGLEVFAERGFAAARLDDVALKAGVGKGTIYLFFDDKEHLFEQIVREAVAPLLELLSGIAAQGDEPAAVVFERIFRAFESEIIKTRRSEIVRLVLAEGARFPALAEFYHREVISKALVVLQQIARQAYARGELSADTYARFPHLVVAPLLIALLWDGLFSKFEKLDFDGLIAAHLSNLVRGEATRKRRKP